MRKTHGMGSVANGSFLPRHDCGIVLNDTLTRTPALSYI